LGLQTAIADGSEPTFDGQPMQAGTHLRWAFAPELGFPPGAFWLCRRSLRESRCGPGAPPVAVSKAIEGQRGDGKDASTGTATAAASTNDPQGLGSAVSFSGADDAAPRERCGRCCCCLALAAVEKAAAGRTATAKQGVTGAVVNAGNDPTAGASEFLSRCECGHAFVGLCQADAPKSESAAHCDCCRCSAKRQPPVTLSITICCCCASDEGGTGNGKGSGNGTGTVGGTGWGPGPGEWGPPDECGWQLWGEPFTLPVTCANWPARYAGALDPSTHSDPVLANRDVLECRRRLGALDLLKGMSTSTEQSYFKQLRAECVRLVQGWPATPNYAVGIDASDDGSAAPQLSLRLVSQLQMSALSPYLARVLGLYFVDTEADPDEEYQYCIVGLWANQVPPQVLSPGSAPTGALARGTANFDGMTITADPSISHLFAWQSTDGSTQPPAQIQGVPAAVAAAFTVAPARSPTLAELTEREREVLALVARGLSNAELAETLDVSLPTVKTHVSRILTKLGARDRTQLVVLAYESGLVTTAGPPG
jgi:DNA-binding CsgD family transcriptional regulator